jgi:hypothetical protein
MDAHLIIFCEGCNLVIRRLGLDVVNYWMSETMGETMDALVRMSVPDPIPMSVCPSWSNFSLQSRLHLSTQLDIPSNLVQSRSLSSMEFSVQSQRSAASPVSPTAAEDSGVGYLSSTFYASIVQ